MDLSSIHSIVFFSCGQLLLYCDMSVLKCVEWRCQSCCCFWYFLSWKIDIIVRVDSPTQLSFIGPQKLDSFHYYCRVSFAYARRFFHLSIILFFFSLSPQSDFDVRWSSNRLYITYYIFNCYCRVFCCVWVLCARKYAPITIVDLTSIRE